MKALKLKPEFKRVVLIRYEAFLADTRKWITENTKYANYWGIFHILIGLSAVTFSTVSSVFTFNNQNKIGVVTGILAAVSTSTLTFLNPAVRELKRRRLVSQFNRINNRIEKDIVQLDSSSLCEEDVIKELEFVASKIEEITRDFLDPL